MAGRKIVSGSSKTFDDLQLLIWNQILSRNLKKKQQQEALLAEQKRNDEKEKELQKQQSIREQKLIDWLNRKKHEMEKSRMIDNEKPDEKSTKTTFLLETKADQTKLNFDAWKTKKLEKEKSLKVKEERQIRMDEKLKEIQRSLSLEKHKLWLKTAHEKPRPVPLNQGLLSNSNISAYL